SGPGIEGQQVGYVVAKNDDGREALHQVIATPIVTTDTGEAIGAIVLGFAPMELDAKHAGAEIKSGLWLDRALHMPSMTQPAAAALGRAVTKAVGAPGRPESSFAVDVNGAPHLLFYKMLNPGSRFAPAYQVCVYPLAESLARERRMRWKIIGSGLLLLLAGLAASHFVSGRMSAPVERLAEHSAELLAQRERAEAALEMTNEELRALNAELQKAVADLKATQQQVIQQERLRALG